jgi:hypothetical protein
MEAFVKQVLGREYKLSIMNILFRSKTLDPAKGEDFFKRALSQDDSTESSSSSALEEQKEDGDEKGYFCSELIAKAYKHVGLLQT